MIGKFSDRFKRQQSTPRSSLKRTVDEIASTAGTDHGSVLKAASQLGIVANDRSASLSVGDAAKIHAQLLPAPAPPRVRATKPERRVSKQDPSDDTVIAPSPQVQQRIPLRNPFHVRRERVQPAPRYPSSKPKKSQITSAPPATFPTSALIPPKPPRTRTIPAVISKPVVASTSGGNGTRAPALISDDVQFRGNEDSLPGLPMPALDAYEDLLFVTSLLALLDNFSPRDYGKLFFYLGDAIDLDLRVRPLILKSQQGVDTDQLSNPEELRFLRAICHYKYGIFGYPPSVRLVARDARQRTSTDTSATVNAVLRLRPMVRGLMTDMVGRRFIAWDVDQETRLLLTVAFDDLEQWIRGLLSGRYIRLRSSFLDVLKPANETDWETIQFMAAAAENLRTSIQFVKQKRNPTQSTPRRTELSATSKNAHMGTPVTVRDHNKLLIPITIEDGREVYFGLEEGFFESKAVAPQKHEVREFYRRAPGTPYDAPKTIRVASHTRGGTIFDDPRARMPAVSILGGRKHF